MNETATPPPADAAPLLEGFAAAFWIAMVVAFADLQFVQWTSSTMRPALVVFSGLLNLALFSAVATLLLAAANVIVRLSPRWRPVVVPIVFVGVGAVWLVSRVRLATLQSADLAGWSAVVAPLLTLVGLLAYAARPQRDGGCSSTRVVLLGVIWTGMAVVWMIHLSRATVASPVLGGALALVAACGVNAPWVARSAGLKPWVRVAGVVGLNALVLIVSYPVVPGFDRPYRTDGGAVTQDGVPQPGAADGSPNVIVIVLDTLRADHMSTYGYEYDTTPQLTAFAAGATVFEPGIANATWSLPSHASLLTGLLPHQHGAHAVLAAISQSPEARAARRESGGGTGAPGAETFSFAQRPLSAAHETLAELLAARGYSTAAIVANFGWVSDFFGLLQGFHYVDNRPMNLFNWEPVAAPYLRRSGWDWLNDRYILLNKSAFFADSIVAHARDWEAQRPARPFFLLLNFMDAHAPFRASLLTDGFEGRLPDIAADGEQSQVIARYDRSIAYLDDQVGELFDFLRAGDLFDNSLIVVTSDHGENFDDDRPAAHGADLLQATVAVPLIIKLPHQTEGSRPGRVGQLIDVVPTVRDVLALPPAPQFFGSAMAERPRAVIAENYFSALFGAYAAEFEGSEAEMLAAFPSQWTLFEGQWKLLYSLAGESRLFDLATDPQGLRDVRLMHPEVTAALEERLRELLPEGAFSAARLPSPIEMPDRQTIERLRGLGYLR